MKTCRFSKKQIIIFVFAATLAISVVLSSFGYLNSLSRYPAGMDSITFGDLPFSTSALVYVAQHQHFFASDGINLTIKAYASGRENINALLNNSIDVAYAGEFALVANGVLKGENISAIGSVVKYQDFYLVARRDAGIESFSNLKGKRIAVTLNGASEFYLGTLLELSGLGIQNVTLVNLPSSQMVNAITDGTVDAMVASSPYYEQAQAQLANNSVVWPAQSSQMGYGLLLCRNSWIAQNPDIVVRFLRSLSRAEDYITNNPSEAENIVEKELNQTQDVVSQAWSSYQFSLTLDQSLIVAMTDEGQWMIRNNFTNYTVVPHILDYVYSEGLKSVKPGAVNIIG